MSSSTARDLGAEPGLADERAGDDLHPIADAGVFPSALCVWQVDGAVAFAGAQGVDDFVGHVHRLVVADPPRMVAA
jgi:hypothetical protein